MEVYVDDEAKLTLHGLQQHYVKLKDSEKNRKLFELLDVLEFNQVVIFVKSVQRCMALAQLLIEQNFPAIAIHRGMTQEERLSRYQSFKDFQKVSLSFSFFCCFPVTLPMNIVGLAPNINCLALEPMGIIMIQNPFLVLDNILN